LTTHHTNTGEKHRAAQQHVERQARLPNGRDHDSAQSEGWRQRRAGLELGCTVRYTAVDELTATLGTEALAEADLLALDIQRSLKYRDPGRLMKYLPF